MTVSYTAQVANAKGFGCFLKLLFRWKGSIYKLVWPDLFVFLATYFSLSFTYRVLLDDEQQKIFEKISIYCEKYGNLIPVSFVLGFYVSFVMGRWWEQYKNIPRIDTLAIWVNASLCGSGDKERLLRRTIMRYVCLSITWCFVQICPRVKKRFPTLEHFLEAGLLIEGEREILKEIQESLPKYEFQFIPLVWASCIATRARRENILKNDSVVKSIVDEVNKIKDQCSLLLSFDWISVPLVYTQVVTLSVYSYFLACIMGRQWIHNVGGTDSSTKGRYGVEELDLFVPIFTVLQFLFYMGWLKVAETLLNPFGEDDDDFELNWLIDRNLQVAYLVVDEMHTSLQPNLLRDKFWEDVFPDFLPHTAASEQYKEQPPISSTANVIVTKEESEIVPHPSLRSVERINLLGVADLPDTPGLMKRPSMRSVQRQRYPSVRSTTSINSIARKGSLGGSKFSLFKRLISRENSSKLSLHEAEGGLGGGGEGLGSTMNVNDTIPELDENMVTVISMKQDGEPRKPTVQEIFGQSPPATPTMFVFDEEMKQLGSSRDDGDLLLGEPLTPTPSSSSGLVFKMNGDNNERSKSS